MALTKAVTVRWVHWKPVWSLAALYGAITIGWIAYFNYQTRLLEKFQLTAIAPLLVIVQAVILVVTPPIAGALGDRFRRKDGSRLPIISLGISFAAMIFMAVAFTVLSGSSEATRAILPVLIIFWLVSMGIFTSPAVSAIELFGPKEEMPRVMATLTIVSHLLYSLEAVIVQVIDFIGASPTFILGGVLVFSTGWLLKRNTMSLMLSGDISDKTSTGKRRIDYAWVILGGMGLGLATGLLFDVFPAVLNQSGFYTKSDAKIVIALIFGLAALISLPASQLAEKYKLTYLSILAYVLIFMATMGFFVAANEYMLLVFAGIFAAGFSLLSVISLPMVLPRISSSHKVFGVGLFFGALELPKSILDILF